MTTTTNALIWVIDDDKSIRWVLQKAFSREGYDIDTFEDGNEVMSALETEKPDAIFSDIRMPGIDGLTLLERVSAKYPDIPVIIMTAHSDLDSAVGAYQTGAFDYLPKPFDLEQATSLAERAIQHKRKKTSEINEATATQSGKAFSEIIGEAPAMQEVFRVIGRLSASNINVLVNGESGTGKELVAKALHRHSPRAGQPFIALNMAAIPKDLIETELFGHEKGAFTGATSQRKGRFEQADNGTLFLDEIGDMPAETQTRLLRVLSQGEFYRVGGHTPVKVNVRIIAATHQNLEERVRKHEFREDLFHRLNVIRVFLPPLKDRKEDIPLLAQHFLSKAAEDMDVPCKQLSEDALESLVSWDWPGNVRELENTCRWLTVMAPSQDITSDDLPSEFKEPHVDARDTAQPVDFSTPPSTKSFSNETQTRSPEPQVAAPISADDIPSDEWPELLRRWAVERLASGDVHLVKQAVPKVERVLIQVALKHTNGRRKDAADLLGWGRNTITRKLKEMTP